MTATLLVAETAAENPIDLIEQLVSENEWPFERGGDGDLSACVTGSWCDYSLSYALAGEHEVLTVTAAFDFRTPHARRTELCTLLAKINERLWLGHFDLASAEGLIVYRHAVPLGGQARATAEQCEQMTRAALDACERFYPAFQFVLWGGKTADEAIAAAILDCQGVA